MPNKSIKPNANRYALVVGLFPALGALMHSFSFGGKEQERLEIIAIAREGDTSDDYTWLTVQVSIRAGHFQGQFPAAFVTQELADLYRQGMILYESLKGTVDFKTLERQLEFTMTSNNLGHIKLKGEARDEAGTGNALKFSLMFDQTQLRASLVELASLLSAFKVRT